jgi:transposase
MQKEPVMEEIITWVGMDAHKQFILVAVRLPRRTDVVDWKVKNEPRAVKRLAKKLVREAKGSEVRCCYEAGPCGYALQRQMQEAASLFVEVIAPTLIPRKPGDRVKTDRRDARKLRDLLEAGLLTEVLAPTEEEEAVRDLFRCREDAREDLMGHRHQLSKFLLRRGIVFTEGKINWTRKHHEWLRRQRFDKPVDQVVFDDYLLAVEQTQERLKSLTEHLEQISQQDPYREPVGWMRSFRGIDTVTAMGLKSELFNFARFESPRRLSGFLGITPSEHSSSGKANRGRITKTGNGNARRLLIEAAQHYRHRPGVGAALRKRREGQPAQVIAIADKAQQRLHRRYHRLVARGVLPNKALVAVARELAGFLWAAMNHQQLDVAA